MKGAQGSVKWAVRGCWEKHAVAWRQAPPGPQTCPRRGAHFLRGSPCREGAASASRASERMHQGGADVMGAAVCCGVRCVEAALPAPAASLDIYGFQGKPGWQPTVLKAEK